MTYIYAEEEFTLPIFRVIDLRAEDNETELHAEAKSPEMAAEKALGLKLVRAGNPRNLVCRVYWKDEVNTNMVRLYSRSTQPRPSVRDAANAHTPGV